MGEIIDARKRFDLIRRIQEFEFEGRRGENAVKMAYSQYGYFSDSLDRYFDVCQMYYHLDPFEKEEEIRTTKRIYKTNPKYESNCPFSNIRYEAAKTLNKNN